MSDMRQATGSTGRAALGVLAAVLAAASPGVAAGAQPAKAPANHALRAAASADSEYSAAYAARHVVDGKIPDPLSRADGGAGWAVNGQTHGSGAALTLTWREPVDVAEIVYFGRTCNAWNENFMDYAVYLDEASEPAAKGSLKGGRGPQRIRLARPAAARKVVLKFLSSCGGPNPGAVEVQVYSASPPDWLLGRFVADDPGGGAGAAAPIPRKLPPASPAKPGELLKRALAGPMAAVKEIVFAVRAPGRDGHWYANFGYYARGTERTIYGRGGGGLYRLDLRDGKVSPILADPGGAVRDPQVHYDGRRIVLSYRKAGSDHYHLYEVQADGTGLKQLTSGPWDDIEPTCVPDGGIIFCSSRCKRWVNCWMTQVAILYRCDADGGNLRMLSSNGEHDNTPWVLPDGRVLYTRWEYTDRSQVLFHHLWVMNPDGAGQMVYFGNMYPGTVMIDAKPIPGTNRSVAVFSPGHGRREHEGPIYVVDPDNGPDHRPSSRPLGRLSGRDPCAISEDCFLVAQGGRVILADGAGRTETLYELPGELARAGLQVHEVRPLCPRPREQPIAPKVNLARRTGRVVLADVAIGRSMGGVKPGEIRQLLVLEVLPKPVNFTGGMDPLTYGGSFTLERVVGTVPVEPDGSAHVELPALRSFFFVALDAAGQSVKRMQSFLTVQPGEVFSCVGCHEERQQVPPVRPDLLALRYPPSRPKPFDGVPDVLDFPRDVQPILDRHCLRCHDYDKRSGGVILSGDRGPMFSHGYCTLTIRKQFADGRNALGNRAPRTIGTSASPLMEKIAGGHHDVKVSPRQYQVVRLWIETGSPYPGTYAALGTGMIGGYDTNRQVETDYAWPETKAAGAAIQRRCGACHTGAKRLPRALSDENGLSFWQPSWSDPRLHRSRHLVFNLTRPEKSLILLAPLSRQAGGCGLCKGVAPVAAVAPAAGRPARPTAGKPAEKAGVIGELLAEFGDDGPAAKKRDRTDAAEDRGRGQGDPAPAGRPAPAEAAGGRDEAPAVFAGTDDADYQLILAMIRKGKERLEEIKRFDMPGFRPDPAYVREMKRYGVLPASTGPADPIDVYEVDQAYWRSLWWVPRRP